MKYNNFARFFTSTAQKKVAATTVTGAAILTAFSDKTTARAGDFLMINGCPVRLETSAELRNKLRP